jgi:hypothetical protein
MELPVSINTFGSVATFGLGVFGLFWPKAAATMVGIVPEGERGLSEVRATYGGFFLAMGLYATIWQSNEVFRGLGLAWLAAAAARAFSFVKDDSRSGANVGGIVMEAAIGASLLIPWDLFFGA